MDVMRILVLIGLIYPPLVFVYFIFSKIVRVASERQGDGEFVIRTRNEKIPDAGGTFEMYAPGRRLKVGDAYPVMDKGGEVLAMAECVADVSREKRGWVNVFKVDPKTHKGKIEKRNVGKDTYRFEILE